MFVQVVFLPTLSVRPALRSLHRREVANTYFLIFIVFFHSQAALLLMFSWPPYVLLAFEATAPLIHAYLGIALTSFYFVDELVMLSRILLRYVYIILVLVVLVTHLTMRIFPWRRYAFVAMFLGPVLTVVASRITLL